MKFIDKSSSRIEDKYIYNIFMGTFQISWNVIIMNDAIVAAIHLSISVVIDCSCFTAIAMAIPHAQAII